MRSNFQGYTIPIDQEGTLPDYRNLSMQELNAQSYKITRRQDNNNPQAPDVSLQKKKGLSEERLRAGRHNENSKRTSTPSLTSIHSSKPDLHSEEDKGTSWAYGRSLPEVFPFYPRKGKAPRAEGTKPPLIGFCTSALALYGSLRVHSKKTLCF